MKLDVRQSFCRSPSVLVGLRLPQPDVQAIVPAHGDEMGEFTAAVCAGEAGEQRRRTAPFEDFIGPAAAPFPCGRYEDFDVVDQQRVSQCAGSICRGGVLAPVPRTGSPSPTRVRTGQMAGRAMLVVDRGDPGTKGDDESPPIGMVPPLSLFAWPPPAESRVAWSWRQVPHSPETGSPLRDGLVGSPYREPAQVTVRSAEQNCAEPAFSHAAAEK